MVMEDPETLDTAKDLPHQLVWHCPNSGCSEQGSLNVNWWPKHCFQSDNATFIINHCSRDLPQHAKMAPCAGVLLHTVASCQESQPAQVALLNGRPGQVDQAWMLVVPRRDFMLNCYSRPMPLALVLNTGETPVVLVLSRGFKGLSRSALHS